MNTTHNNVMCTERNTRHYNTSTRITKKVIIIKKTNFSILLSTSFGFSVVRLSVVNVLNDIR